jgi:cytochrome b561
MGKYSKIAILFHWAIAILIGANILLASLTEDLPRAARAAYMSPHKAIGISILILTIGRIFGALAIALSPCLVSWVAFKRRQDVPRIFFSTF